MNVLIIGGTGLISRAITRFLVARSAYLNCSCMISRFHTQVWVQKAAQGSVIQDTRSSDSITR